MENENNKFNGLEQKEFNIKRVHPDRLKIATQILAGLVSNYTLKEPEDQDTLTELSFQLADNLIEKENK